MSVTFQVQQDITAFTITCSCGATTAVTAYLTYQDAVDAYRVGVNPVCGEAFCAAYRCNITAVVAYDNIVNVSNVNAIHLLAVLGLPADDLCGSIKAADLMGRILMAHAINPADAGIPATQQGNTIYMGRAEGYTENRLQGLQELAQHAMEQNLTVCWG